MISKFGWSLPPGVSTRDIENAYGEEGPCDMCGGTVDDTCICPECSICGSVGDPACYDGSLHCSWCGVTSDERRQICLSCKSIPDIHEQIFIYRLSHGLIRNAAQIENRAVYDKHVEEENRAISTYDEWSNMFYGNAL